MELIKEDMVDVLSIVEVINEKMVNIYLSDASDETSFFGRKEIALSHYRENKILALRNELVQELDNETISSYKHQIENRIEMLDLMAKANIDYDTIEYHAYNLISDEELVEFKTFKADIVVFDSIGLKRPSGGYARKYERKYLKSKLDRMILN